MLMTKNPALVAELLKNNKVCAIPTETVYGLAGNGLNPEVISRIFEIKNRPHFDPLILHIPSMNALDGLVYKITTPLEKLMNQFWPGPLTILLPRTDKIPDLISSGSSNAGFRVPDHNLTLELLKLIDFPLAAPSANPFGYISPTKVSHVLDQLEEKIDGILDGGDCVIGIESTVIGEGEGCIEIYRSGAITAEEIEEVSGMRVSIKSIHEHPTAPGMLESHYAPKKPFFLDLSETKDSDSTAWLRYSSIKEGINPERQFLLTTDNNLKTAAHRLFAMMRQLDQDKRFDKIIAQLVPETGLGIAINDKLRKASAANRNP